MRTCQRPNHSRHHGIKLRKHRAISSRPLSKRLSRGCRTCKRAAGAYSRRKRVDFAASLCQDFGPRHLVVSKLVGRIVKLICPHRWIALKTATGQRESTKFSSSRFEEKQCWLGSGSDSLGGRLSITTFLVVHWLEVKCAFGTYMQRYKIPICPTKQRKQARSN